MYWQSPALLLRYHYQHCLCKPQLLAQVYESPLLSSQGDQAWAGGWFHDHPTRDPHDEGKPWHQIIIIIIIIIIITMNSRCICPPILNAGPLYPSLFVGNYLCCENDDSVTSLISPIICHHHDCYFILYMLSSPHTTSHWHCVWHPLCW